MVLAACYINVTTHDAGLVKYIYNDTLLGMIGPACSLPFDARPYMEEIGQYCLWPDDGRAEKNLNRQLKFILYFMWSQNGS